MHYFKKKNYLFVDGRYTIQAQIESGKILKLLDYEKLLIVIYLKI